MTLHTKASLTGRLTSAYWSLSRKHCETVPKNHSAIAASERSRQKDVKARPVLLAPRGIRLVPRESCEEVSAQNTSDLYKMLGDSCWCCEGWSGEL